MCIVIHLYLAVDGIWAPWSEWTGCSVDASGNCGVNDRLVRNRTCTDPPPQVNGEYCPGANFTTNIFGKYTCSLQQ